MTGTCAACGLPGHRYGRNEGMDRFDPQACINLLSSKLDELRADVVARESMRLKAEGRAEGWLALGIAPEPQTVRQTIRYHIGHGLAMGYPLTEVLAFAWRNRRSFERSMDRPDEQALRDAWADGYEWARHHGPADGES